MRRHPDRHHNPLSSPTLGLFCFGFEGTSPPGYIRQFLEGGGAGTILFRRNFESARQILDLNITLRNLATPTLPPLSLVDQEGGPVLRLGPYGSPVPAMAVVGAAGHPTITADVGRLIGRELWALGFNANAAPVLDVHTEPNNPIIGSRAFGTDPSVCAKHGAALARGLHERGVLACAKHFPGHGHTTADSHLELPRLPHNAERLRGVELVPFRHALAKAHIPLVMTAHVLYEGVDAEHPATLSSLLLGRLLRDELGYEGAIVTDDLEMAALSERYSPEQMVELGLEAGVDLFLICKSETMQQRAMEHAHKLWIDGKLTDERLARSRARLARSRSFLRSFAPASAQDQQRWLRCEEHLALCARFG